MIRLGVVSYLNSRPLIEGLDGRADVELTFDVPALQAGLLLRGAVDAALLPIVDVLRHHERLCVVSNACIACDGETMTVRVFSQVPPDRVTRIHVDGHSHTSVALASILWRELYGRDVILQPFQYESQAPDEFEAVLLIGDKVIDPRRGSFAYEVDLGGAWRAQFGLPFVFAIWAGRSSELSGASSELKRGSSAPSERNSLLATLNSLLTSARDRGVVRAAAIAREQGPGLGWPVELAERYLTRCLKFRLDPRFVEGANLFARACAARGLVPPDCRIEWPESCL
ncbi:Chorismate dehydratase [Phycisphaerae bacterium RAS1]|nr:Chorismate dehydratase [Phycisphaerae bacterium RAS1]